MTTRRVNRRHAVVGLVLLTGLLIAALAQSFYPHGLQPIAANLLSPAVRDIDAFLATQLADAATASHQFAPKVVSLSSDGGDPGVEDAAAFTTIERQLWDALLSNNQRQDHQSDAAIYADTRGRFIALREPSPNHFQFSRRTLKEDPPAYRPVEARVMELAPLPRSFDPRTRPWYRHAVKERRAIWVPVFADYESGIPEQVLALPLYRADGTLRGVAAFDIDLTALTTKISQALPHKDASAYLVNELGQIITHAGDLPTPSEFGPRWPVRASASGVAERNPIPRSPVSFTSDGQTYWMVAHPIAGPANPNWQLIVTIPQSSLVALWWQRHGKDSALSFAALLLLPLLVFALIRKKLKRLNDLKGIVSLAVGEQVAETIPLQTDQQIQELKDKVARRLRTDRLTSVLNRETFVAQVRSRCMNPSLFEPTSFSLLFIDLNGFKAVNDTHGHQAGDQVLKTAARRMKQQLDREDAIARFGGDEFVIYAHDTGDLTLAEALRDRLQRVLAEPITLQNGVTVTISGAIGITQYPDDGQELDLLMALADERMYEAKRAMKQSDTPSNEDGIASSEKAMMEIVERQHHTRTQPRWEPPQAIHTQLVRRLPREAAQPREVKASPDQIHVRWAGPTFSLPSQKDERPPNPPRHNPSTARAHHAPSSPPYPG